MNSTSILMLMRTCVFTLSLLSAGLSGNVWAELDQIQVVSDSSVSLKNNELHKQAINSHKDVAITKLSQNNRVSSISDSPLKTLTFGIVPQQSAKKLAATWGPVLQKLSENTGINIRFATAANIPTFEKRLAEKKYDIAYMNPYHYTQYSKRPGYRVIAKQSNKKIIGIIVVAKDSEFRSIDDLANIKMAFPAPLAFAATMIPHASLQQRDLAITPRYVQSHDSVYMNVARGFFPAGGGVKRTLNAAPEGVRKQLRILWESKPYTSHAIAVSPELPDEIEVKIRDGLVAIKEKSLLEGINFKGFSRAEDAQWDQIRELGINVADATQ